MDRPLSIEEVAVLQEDIDSDSDASTVLLEESPRSPREPPIPEWSPATATAVDPIFGHAEPIIVSQVDPRAGFDMTNPLDRMIRREKDRMQMMSSFSNPITKVNAMDLFDIRYQLHQLT